MKTVTIVVETGCAATAVIVTLDDAMRALARQTYPRDRLEILVVDAGDVPQIEARVRAHLPEASIVRLPGGRHYEMKNLGVKSARGEVVAFVDSDVMIPPDWMANAVATLEAAPADVVGVQGRTVLARGFLSRPATALIYGLRLDAAGRHARNLVANNCAFRAEVLRRLPFEQPHLYTTPDSILMERLRAVGGRLVVNESMRGIHDYPGPSFVTARAYVAGRCIVQARRSDRSLPGSWTVRLGPLGLPLVVAGKILGDLRRVVANQRAFRVRWWEWAAFAPFGVLFYASLLTGAFSAYLTRREPRAH